MLEVLQRKADPVRAPSAGSATATRSLIAGWREGLAIVNLRGNAEDAAFRQAAARALGVPLPTAAGTTADNGVVRVVWAGPDDWFVIGPKGPADAVIASLRDALAGQHHAVTDVSSGYTVLQLGGMLARDVLAQGCPLDLHPRAFARGACAGSHFHKASVWLWQVDDAPVYELLVRRSFADYVWLMLERGTAECGLVTRRFA